MDIVSVLNLGCPKNQIDSETMLGLLTEKGYRISPDPGQADIIIVNTCAFIDKARQESIDQILAMAEYKKSGRCKKLIVTGCLSQRHYHELVSELPEVDAFLGTGSVDRIVEILACSESEISEPVMAKR